jgi:hypothetical protein
MLLHAARLLTLLLLGCPVAACSGLVLPMPTLCPEEGADHELRAGMAQHVSNADLRDLLDSFDSDMDDIMQAAQLY